MECADIRSAGEWIWKLRSVLKSVIDKEGSSDDGAGFIQKLWENANSHYNEIESLVKKDEAGDPVGFQGAMGHFSRQSNPMERFYG
jgi:hypothetical protein